MTLLQKPTNSQWASSVTKEKKQSPTIKEKTLNLGEKLQRGGKGPHVICNPHTFFWPLIYFIFIFCNCQSNIMQEIPAPLVLSELLQLSEVNLKLPNVFRCVFPIPGEGWRRSPNGHLQGYHSLSKAPWLLGRHFTWKNQSGFSEEATTGEKGAHQWSLVIVGLSRHLEDSTRLA